MLPNFTSIGCYGWMPWIVASVSATQQEHPLPCLIRTQMASGPPNSKQSNGNAFKRTAGHESDTFWLKDCATMFASCNCAMTVTGCWGLQYACHSFAYSNYRARKWKAVQGIIRYNQTAYQSVCQLSVSLFSNNMASAFLLLAHLMSTVCAQLASFGYHKSCP